MKRRYEKEKFWDSPLGWIVGGIIVASVILWGFELLTMLFEHLAKKGY